MADAVIKPSMTPPAVPAENLLKDKITVDYKGETYTFKIPSVRDTTRILSMSAKLRRDSDPDGIGLPYSYDVGANTYFDRLATFQILLAESSAKWVYSPNPTGGGAPVMDLDKWPDDAPVMEVINQFNDELERFRSSRN